MGKNETALPTGESGAGQASLPRNGGSRSHKDFPVLQWVYTTATETTFVFTTPETPDPDFDPVIFVKARDEQGAEDPTPAEWRVLGGSAAGPILTVQKSNLDGSDPAPFASGDTIGYGESFRLTWEGTTTTAMYLPADMVVRLDTVPPPDGLLGFKYRLDWEDCDPVAQDCWYPRRFDGASGDSASYFGDVQTVPFPNDDSGPAPSQKRLSSGRHQIWLNALDIVGLEVPADTQPIDLVVNYDPESRLLIQEADPYFTDDTHIYPYYLVYYPAWAPGGARVEEYSFAPGDTVPDRAVVVFKAVGRDDSRDQPAVPGEEWDVQFQGQFRAVGKIFTSEFPFQTQYSEPHWTPDWTPDQEGGWSADTLSFAVGPFAYTTAMRAVDEHGRRDAIPDTISFVGNFPPCVQCVEVTNITTTSTYAESNDCWDQDCASRSDSLFAAWGIPQPSGPDYVTFVDMGGKIYYKLDTGDVWLERPLQITGVDSVTAPHYGYKLWLHGKDHPLEPPVDPEDRIMSWRYQVDYENDDGNVIRDGGGFDVLQWSTSHFSTDPEDPIYIDENGVWVLQIRLAVPFALLVGDSRDAAVETYREELYLLYNDWEDVDRAFELTTMQLGRASASVIARDASDCDARIQKGKYHYFRHVRVPVEHGRVCNDFYEGEENQLILNDFSAESSSLVDPFVKHYFLGIEYPNGDIYPAAGKAFRHW
jgi:hypothetical protein